MIVSFQHNFIFLKTKKVAGSSVELYLRQFCGSDDIVTRLMPDEESLAHELGARAPSSIRSRPALPWELTIEKLKNIPIRGAWPTTAQWWTHQPAAEVRRKIGRSRWNDAFRFSIVRNPWDRVVSSYFWISHSPRHEASLDQIIEGSNRNWPIFTIRNKLAVDYVIRFENLLQDFGDVCESIGIPRPESLPNLKSGYRPTNLRPREILTKKQADRVAKLCRREIELFGYEYDPG